MSGISHHDFEGLHRYINEHLDKADNIRMLKQSAERLEKAKREKMPPFFIEAVIDHMRQLLLRIEDEG